ncbi:MAG: hypothetical protein V1676_03395 [Candidatus Diapherotrites archaeon]
MPSEKITIAQRQKMGRILGEMERKLKELDRLRADLKKEKFGRVSPQKSKAMLEEIKVPALELIKD